MKFFRIPINSKFIQHCFGISLFIRFLSSSNYECTKLFNIQFKNWILLLCDRDELNHSPDKNDEESFSYLKLWKVSSLLTGKRSWLGFVKWVKTWIPASSASGWYKVVERYSRWLKILIKTRSLWKSSIVCCFIKETVYKWNLKRYLYVWSWMLHLSALFMSFLYLITRNNVFQLNAELKRHLCDVVLVDVPIEIHKLYGASIWNRLLIVKCFMFNFWLTLFSPLNTFQDERSEQKKILSNEFDCVVVEEI